MPSGRSAGTAGGRTAGKASALEQLECLPGEQMDLHLLLDGLHLDLGLLSPWGNLPDCLGWICCHGRGDGVFSFFGTGQCSGSGHCSCSTPCHKPGTCLGMAVATLVALGDCCEGILVDGGS